MVSKIDSDAGMFVKVEHESVFAEGKEKHGLRFTRYKGRQKNFDMRALLYVYLNIKKLGNQLYKFPSYMKRLNKEWA